MIKYLPRQDQADLPNGAITKYNLYVSADGITFTTLVDQGMWDLNELEKIIKFDAISVRYVKLEALEGYKDLAVAGEISIGYKPTENVAPTATVSYDVTKTTFKAVTATITPSEPITVVNNGGSSSYKFYFNGSFTFQFIDALGMPGTATATVKNIKTKSKDKPGKPILSLDNRHKIRNKYGDYNVTMNMRRGENGVIYKIYENNVLIDTKILSDNSPSAQKVVTAIIGKKNGKYSYYAELINAFGTTTSKTLVVTVRGNSCKIDGYQY